MTVGRAVHSASMDAIGFPTQIDSDFPLFLVFHSNFNPNLKFHVNLTISHHLHPAYHQRNEEK